MKLKKLLALTLAGAVLTASLTACTPLDAAELVYDSIFGGGSSSTGSGLTAEEAENRAVAKAYVQSLIDNPKTRPNYENIKPVDYDIPRLEEFVKAIDKYCTEECKTNGKSWEETVRDLPKEKLEELAANVGLYKETYGKPKASLRFGKDPSGTPEQQADSFTRICKPFWYTTQSTPYQGNAWFDSVVLTRTENGSKYRFLLFICHN